MKKSNCVIKKKKNNLQQQQKTQNAFHLSIVKSLWENPEENDKIPLKLQCTFEHNV